jgi:hypothetical protein
MSDTAWIAAENLDVPEWTSNPDKYKYMMDHTRKMFTLLDKHNLRDKVGVRVHRDHHGLYVKFTWHDWTSWITDDWSYNILTDRRETWRCNGFTIYLADKQYYGKQFVNMILTREHYIAVERKRKRDQQQLAQQLKQWA